TTHARPFGPPASATRRPSAAMTSGLAPGCSHASRGAAHFDPRRRTLQAVETDPLARPERIGRSDAVLADRTKRSPFPPRPTGARIVSKRRSHRSRRLPPVTIDWPRPRIRSAQAPVAAGLADRALSWH